MKGLEMAQQLSAPAALPEDPGSTLSTHIATATLDPKLSVTPLPGDLTIPSDFRGL